MPRITYSGTTIGGLMVAEAVDHVRKAKDLLLRAKSLMDSIATGGTAPANLEGSVEFNVAIGQGASFYNTVNGMKSNAGTITDAAIADIDMGG